MAQAKTGDTVKVHYTGKFEDGDVFDTSLDREPLEFTIGQSEVIPGFEQAVVGMTPGESKTTEVPADEGYGSYNDEMILVVDRDQLPEGLEPHLNQQLQVRQENGQTFVVRVTDVSDGSVTLDANHPLAGKNLTFDIELVEIA